MIMISSEFYLENFRNILGLKEPRSLSINGSPLPSPRLVSTAIHDDISIPHVRYTLLLMQYAQLLDHDLTHTPMNRGMV